MGKKKPKNAEKSKVFPTDQPTDRPTDRVGHRVACTRLKIELGQLKDKRDEKQISNALKNSCQKRKGEDGLSDLSTLQKQIIRPFGYELLDK